MSQIRVVVDSVADIPPDMAAELGITIIPALVRFGHEVFEDRVELSASAFYARLAVSPVVPQTSVPGVGVFETVYRQLGQEARNIISIHIPAGKSGMVNTAMIAARSLPDLRIEVVDSTNISMAQGWVAVVAARSARDGHSMDEVLSLVRAIIPKVRLLAVLDTLEYALKGGRIGKGRAMLGTLLRVKPLVQFLDGELLPIENVRTLRRAVSRLVQLTAELGPMAELAVVHGNAHELAVQVREMVEPLHPGGRIPLVEIGPVLGTHAGPGAVGVACVLK